MRGACNFHAAKAVPLDVERNDIVIIFSSMQWSARW